MKKVYDPKCEKLKALEIEEDIFLNKIKTRKSILEGTIVLGLISVVFGPIGIAIGAIVVGSVLTYEATWTREATMKELT